MKKRKSIIQFLSYFSLILMFFFISDISLNAQGFNTGLPKLTDSYLVFKNSEDAIQALDIKILEYRSDIQVLEGEQKQMVENVISMYAAIKEMIKDGNTVKNSAIKVWEAYKVIFNGKYPDDCEAKLADTITVN